jgi:NOL1/NOP2/sun family putative RNA methylase
MPKLPKELLNSLTNLEGFSEKEFIESHEAENKVTSIRLNPFKTDEETKENLNFQLTDSVPWNENGYYLKTRPSFTYDPLFHAGCYYVQEAGSMFIELALKHTLDFNNTLKILDACAAPGGKSTLINSLINENSLLVSNEFIKSRADVLSYNLSKWGTCNGIVTNNDTKKFSALTSYFDAIIVDAPCSGSGLFRKQPEAIDQWNLGMVQSCSLRQKTILKDLIPAVKEDGILIYSTCSYSIEENEEIVKWLIDEFNFEYVFLPIKKEWGIMTTNLGNRFYPHLSKSEGFFCATLKKIKNKNINTSREQKKTTNLTSKDIEIIKPFISIMDNLVIKKNNNYHLLNIVAQTFLNTYEKYFYFKKAGTVLGEIKNKDFIPNHELALSNNISSNIPNIDLDITNTICFFKKMPIKIEYNAVNKGLHLITYNKKRIGWVKILPNRINNYLPNELRIIN